MKYGKDHWDRVYATKREDEVSWYEVTPEISLDLIAATNVGSSARIIDIGGGASRLVDHLIDRGYRSLTVLDLSGEGLRLARQWLGERASAVTWVEADITKWDPLQSYDVWHDRAVLHFLTDREDQASYVSTLKRAIKPGGHVIIGTFGLDGPERCSGLPVQRHDPQSLSHLLGPQFKLASSRVYNHLTPSGRSQMFQFSHFRHDQDR